ncbi:MAG: two-component regulator propeller domain-containing protein [Bacteroidota bacterium]|nr:two-component regulator propeller domain-containing protein [Bacteroidota bacterium]
MGTYNEGIIKYEDQYVYKFPIPALSTPINNSQAVNDNAGHIWVATVSGLWEFWSDKKGKWSSYLHKVLHNNYPQTLLFDKQGRLWVGYAQSTIILYEIIYQKGKSSKLEVIRKIPLKFRPEKSDLLCMMLDRQNRLICSIQNHGILIIEFDSSMAKTRYQLITDSLPDVSIRAIYEDSFGNIWLGGYWGGLGVIEKGDWKNGKKIIIKESDGLPNNAVRAICEDENGNLLVGTRYSGIGVIPKERISSIFWRDKNLPIFCRTITMRDGLVSNAIWCLLKEEQTIFIGTNHGFQAMVYDQVVKFRNFKESLGERVALCGINKNGVSWYITRDVIVIDEDIRYRINLLPPKVLINSFTVDGISIPLDTVYSFSGDNEQFVLEYVGVSLRDGESIEYQYRLKDVVQNWSLWTRDRRISFAGLKPGTHTFEVQAINGDGFISDQPAQIKFTIVAPLWQHWWFILSLFLALTTLFIILVKYFSTRKIKAKLEKVKQEQALQNERTRTREGISRDLHDDIASTLSGIGYFVQAVEKESGTVFSQNSKKYLSLIKESSDEILESIRDIIWSLNPENNNWEVVLAKCRRYTSDLCESKSINYKIKFPENFSKITPPLENLKNFWLAYKEIIANALKHSDCTQMDISIELVENSSFSIQISDNGKGFDVNKVKNGSGLSNIHSRIKMLNGTSELITIRDEGTCWKISFPL